MKTCNKCNKEFPIHYIDDKGITHNLCGRKYCLECSPFKKHNTSQLHKNDPYEYASKEKHGYKCCECGETDKSKFYGTKKQMCGKCHNQYTIQKGQEKRKWAIEQLGGVCKKCGYDEYTCALDIHHTNPNSKDKNFECMRGWSKERILKEIQNCIILCKNCHAIEHYNIRKNVGVG